MRLRPVFLALIVGGLVVANASAAFGVAISPAEIKAKNVLRGSDISRSLTIFNTSDEPEVYRFEAKGKPVGDWVEVTDSDNGKSIESIAVPARGSASVTVIVRVPKTARNLRYKGSLAAVPRSLESTGSSAILIPTLLLDVAVVDHEIINLRLQSFGVPDSEVDDPLEASVGVENLSNVEVPPVITFAIAQGDKILHQAQFEMRLLGLGTAGRDTFSVSPRGLKLGKYQAYAVASYGDGRSLQLVDEFELVPDGTFTKASMERFRVTGTSVVGSKMKVSARFSSRSPKVLEPRLVADVFLDGLKIGRLEGKKRGVRPYDEAEFSVPFTPSRSGDYRIEGYFVFSDKESNHRSETFTARGYEVLAYGFAGLVACVYGFRLVKRRRNENRTVVGR